MNPAPGLIDGQFCTRLVLTLGHFLWQGAGIALLAGVTVFLLRGRAERFRYLVCLTALFLMPAAAVSTFVLIELPAAGSNGLRATSASRSFVPPESRLVETLDADRELSRAPDFQPAPHSMISGRRKPDRPAVIPEASDRPGIERTSGPAFPLPESGATSVPGQPSVAGPIDDSPLPFPSRLPYWVSLAYGCGVSLMLLRLVIGLRGGSRLRQLAMPVNEFELLQAFARQRERIGVGRLPTLAWCAEAAVPTVIGILRPVILLPAGFATGLTPRQLESLIAHELIHIQRWDPVFNILQRLIEAAFFFHPAVWLVSKQIRNERENRTDDAVVRLGFPSIEYAKALLQAAELAVFGRTSETDLIAVRAGESSSQLTRRVRRLLNSHEQEMFALSRPGFLALLLAIAGSVAIASSAGLQKKTDGNETSEELGEEASEGGGRTPPVADSSRGGDSQRLSQPDEDPAPAADVTVKGEIIEGVLHRSFDLARSRDRSRPHTRVVFPGGVEFTVVGLTTFPHNEGDSWWLPTGEPLPGKPVHFVSPKVRGNSQRKRCAILLKVENSPPWVTVRRQWAGDRERGVKSTPERLELSMWSPGPVAHVVSVEEDGTTDELTFLFPGGLWKEEARFVRDQGDSNRFRRTNGSEAREDISIEPPRTPQTSQSIGPNCLVRIHCRSEQEHRSIRAIVINAAGQRIYPGGMSGIPRSETSQIDFFFPATPEDVQEIRIESSGDENTVTFSGLSAEPGKAAQPRVKITAPAVPQPGEFAFTISKTVESRVPFTDPMIGIRTQREIAELLSRYAPPNADPAFQAALRIGLNQHLDRVWPVTLRRDSFAWDDIHLHQLARVRNLQWLLFQFTRNQNLSAKDLKVLTLQRESVRNRIVRAATGDRKGQRDKWLTEFERLLEDPLFPCFRRPLSGEQHTSFAGFLDDLSEPFSMGRLVDAWARAQFPSRQSGNRKPEFTLSTFHEPVWKLARDSESHRLSARYQSTIRQSGVEVALPPISQSGAFVELQSGLAGTASGGAALARTFQDGGATATADWFADQDSGAFYLDAERHRLVGVRGTKFLALTTRYWQETDRIPTALLAQAIKKNGDGSWTFRDTRSPAPTSSLPNTLVAIQTADGRMSVASIPQSPGSLSVRIRPHDTPTPDSGQIPAVAARLIVQSEINGMVDEVDAESSRRLVREISERHFDSDLTNQVRRFVDQLRSGDGDAADFMTPGVSPRTIRSWEWWGDASAGDVQDEWKRIRNAIADGNWKVGPGGFGSLRIWPDFGFDVVRSDRRGYFRLIGVDASGQQWHQVFLLERISSMPPGSQNGWMITGYTAGRNASEDFLHDSPAHSPEWNATEEFLATPRQVEAGNFYLDLDTGSRFTQSAENATAAWIRSTGVDLRFGTQSMKPKSRAIDLFHTVSVLAGEEFSRLTPHAALHRLGQVAPGNPSVTGQQLLRTRSGGVFVLQTRARPNAGLAVRVRQLSRSRLAARTTVEGVYSGDEDSLPTDTDWVLGKYGIQYRIRQEKKLWRLGEHPLVFVDLRSDGSTERLAVSKSQFQHYIDYDGGRYSRSVGGTFHAIPTKGHITLAFVMSPLWQRAPHKDPMPLEPGRHSLRIHVRLGTLPLYDNEGNIIRPPGEQFRPEPIPTVPVAIDISDTDVRQNSQVRADNIRRELLGLTEFHSSMDLPFTLQQMIARHLPQSADVLLSQCESEDAELAHRAATVLVRFLDDLTDDQTVRYFTAGFRHFAEKRDQYPQGIDALINLGYRFEFGHDGLPKDRRYEFQTTTRHFLDGRELEDEPFRYSGHGAASGHVRLKDLALGEHIVRMTTTWEFTRGEKSFRGSFESGSLKFDILPSDIPDDLIAEADPDLAGVVGKSLQFRESQTSFERRSRLEDPRTQQRHWRPSSYTVSRDGTGPAYALHTPFWRMNRPLPVDLAFRMTMRVEGTDLEFPCSDVVVPAGERTYTRHVYTRGPLDELVKQLLKVADKNGFVKVRLVLTPSRAVALQNPEIQRYFPGSITSDVLRIRASTSTEVPPGLPLPDPQFRSENDR